MRFTIFVFVEYHTEDVKQLPHAYGAHGTPPEKGELSERLNFLNRLI